MKEFWTSLASVMGVLAFLQTLLHCIFPLDLRVCSINFLHRFLSNFSSYCYFDITEIDGVNSNELYNAVQIYLSSSASVMASRLTLSRQLNSSCFTYGLSNNDRLSDTFRGVSASWEHVVTPRPAHSFSFRPFSDEKRGFTLRIKKQHKPLILDAYLDYIMDTADEIRRRNQDRRLYTNSRGGSLDSRGQPWESVPFKHPSTFATLAMDPDKKNQIMADLRAFAEGGSFYQKTGRAWKRGYLLYGPPGTGKSSMIAAMANYLSYDIYDLELTEVRTNSDLRKLLMKTTAKSIVVIEDIDCSINLTNRISSRRDGGSIGLPAGAGPHDDGMGDSLTLSGLLNFTDGLWSCCGSEKIFVFTTNHIEKLDPALLRSGRMDMHIFMGYCSFPALKILLNNYLDFDIDAGGLSDELVNELEAVINEAEMTPADITEVLIKNRLDKGKAAVELLETLKAQIDKRREVRTLREKNPDDDHEEEEEQEKREVEVPSDSGGPVSAQMKTVEEEDGEKTD